MSNPYAMEMLRKSLGGCCEGSALLGGAVPRRPKAYEGKSDVALSAAPERLHPKREITQEQREALRVRMKNPEVRARIRQSKFETAANVYNKAVAAEAAGNPMSRLQICQYKCEVIDQKRKARQGVSKALPASLKNNPAYRQQLAVVAQARRILTQAINSGQNARPSKESLLAAQAELRRIVKQLLGVSSSSSSS